LKRAEAGIGQIAAQGRPFELLGAAAPAWTLEKAYGKGQALSDYQGKVVVLDFWATWCPWCIRSFPALRDLLKDYAGQDLVVVGVTTSSASVYEARYDLDDDLKAKASGSPVKPTLVRPRLPAALKPDADDAAKAAFEAAKAAHPAALAEFKAKEQEILATFIGNHAMSWDVVVIDEQEPGPKYALSGWPHCVVIDRQGRIRHFKSGALLREKPEAVAAFRKIIDGLLVEPAKEP
jgi:thiol-disulfide isomerase/thioredoxin